MTSMPRPAELDTFRAVPLDVRPDLREGREPFGKIMAAVNELTPQDALVLRAPFEPVPLYAVMERRGFAHWTECRDATDWSVWFYPASNVPTTAASAPSPAAPGILDVRGLEPPQPMVTVLERLDRLAPGETLVVVHDRRPLFLYPQLDDRGFRHETVEPEPGVVHIRIRRPASPPRRA